MRLTLTPAEEAIRLEVRSFLAEHQPTPEDVPRDFERRMQFLRDWQRRLHEAGLIAVAWPREFGGRGATLMEQIVVDQEMARAGAPEILGSIGLSVVGPSIIDHGTPAQRAAYVDRILAAEDIWCQGFSEPNAGSDLASLKTRAEVADDHFVIHGQKTWTSFAMFATKCAVLAKTDANAPPHKAISYIIVDLDTPGVEARPLVQTTGDAEFGELFFDDVVVPRENLLGPLHAGWTIAMHTLSHERGPYAMARQVLLRAALDRLIRDAAQIPRGGRPASEDPAVRQLLASAHVAVEVLRRQCYRSVGRIMHGAEPGFDSSVDKLLLAEAEQTVAAAALEVLGAFAASADGGPWDVELAAWHRFYLYGRAASIYGGSSQIQKNIVAQRILGLPRG
jgi:alkylation response protein AidB-like acyl-CoA dehydrogenase